MSAFKDRPFADRLSAMGDEAELVFEEVYEHAWTRTGHRRPKVRVADFHQHERYRPDYAVSIGYIEVMGHGQDQRLKLKLEKLESLKFWQLLKPVYLFVWDSFNERYTLVPLEDVDKLSRTAAVEQFPDDGKWYYSIDAAGLFGD